MAKEVEYCYNGREKLLLSSIGGNKSTDVTGRDAQSGLDSLAQDSKVGHTRKGLV